jgi:hypothetical protein
MSQAMNSLPAAKALDAFFFDARSKILDLAAFLDRIERGDNAAEIRNDPRLDKVRRAVHVLLDDGDDRAEQVQTIFSLDYDAGWEQPKPRY